MAYQQKPQFPTIPLSGTVSDPLVYPHTDIVALWIPTVTSGSMTIQAAYSTSPVSADYLPVVNAPPSSGPFVLWIGPGSLSVQLSTTLGAFPAIRFVSSVPQSAIRSLAAIYKV